MLGEIAFQEIFHCDIEILGFLEPSQEFHEQFRTLKWLAVRPQQGNPRWAGNRGKVTRERGDKPFANMANHEELPRVIEAEG